MKTTPCLCLLTIPLVLKLHILLSLPYSVTLEMLTAGLLPDVGTGLTSDATVVAGTGMSFPQPTANVPLSTPTLTVPPSVSFCAPGTAQAIGLQTCVLYFFAPHCPYCAQETPLLNALLRGRIDIVGIAMDTTPDALMARKLRSALMAEGEFVEDGLWAFGDEGDMTRELTRCLLDGHAVPGLEETFAVVQALRPCSPEPEPEATAMLATEIPTPAAIPLSEPFPDAVSLVDTQESLRSGDQVRALEQLAMLRTQKKAADARRKRLSLRLTPRRSGRPLV